MGLTERFELRLPREERDLVRDLAEREGKNQSAVVRDLLREAARRRSPVLLAKEESPPLNAA